VTLPHVGQNTSFFLASAPFFLRVFSLTGRLAPSILLYPPIMIGPITVVGFPSPFTLWKTYSSLVFNFISLDYIFFPPPHFTPKSGSPFLPLRKH